MKPSLKRRIFFLGGIFFLSVLLAITKGSANIPLSKLFINENRIILYLRLLRVWVAVLAGSGLAVSGIALQAILRNPLAEPYLLGTSSGAGLGAITAIVCGLGAVYIPAAAFIGAMLTMVLVYNLAKQGNKVAVHSLILSGVIVSVAFSGLIVFLASTSSNEALHGLTWWLWGSLQVYDLKLLLIVSCVVIAGIIGVFILSQDLNAMSLGEEDAIHLGIKIETAKKILFLITSLITASLVCICGVIGFVGFIVPHATRLIVGPNHKTLIPSTCLAASTFMVLSDLASRTIFTPLEIPIGVITAIIGAPIFIILLKIKQKII